MGAQRWVVPAGQSITTAEGPLASKVSRADAFVVVVLAADHDRIVAEAEARGWNAAITNRPAPYEGLWLSWRDIDRLIALAKAEALRKPEVEG